MKSVVLYTQPNCPPCEFAKNFFKEKNIAVTIKNVKEDQKALQELTKKYKSYSTPTIVIDGKVIIGFDQEKIELALGV